MCDVKSIIQENNTVLVKMLDQCVADIKAASDLSILAIKNGKKIIWCGNGGSAADAQHMAAELMGGLVSHDREPIPSIALTTDTSFITAWANDTGYETIFSRQIDGLGNAGDILIAISTSGNSVNVLRAIKCAKNKKMKTNSVAFLKDCSDFPIFLQVFSFPRTRSRKFIKKNGSGK